jgi:hypothetical protein
VRAQITVDGHLAGPALILVDVDYQARTRGGTEMEGIREGKAVFKSTTRAAGVTLLALAAGDDSHAGSRDKAAVGLGLLLLSALTSASADVRHWPTLPSTVQVLALAVEPGEHTLAVEFLDTRGNVLHYLTQETAVDVPQGGESYYYFRSLPRWDPNPKVTQ